MSSSRFSRPGITATIVALLAAHTGEALANSETGALVDEQHCMFCHTAEAPHLALSFPQIAARYRKIPGARCALEQKLSLEGPAHWGDITMPVADQVDPLSPKDASIVAQWLLKQR